MRFLRVILLLALALCAYNAHAQHPVIAEPQPSWGGYALPSQVPYQPTLPDGSVPYPATDSQIFIDPSGVQIPPTEDPIYDGAPPRTLRESLTPSDARNGFFQKAKFSATWLPQLEEDGMGWTDLRTEVVTALPFFTRENPIIITPSYEIHFIDGPEGIDLPPRLHDLALDLHIFRVYANKWIADFAVTPGLYADDHSFDSDEALRVNGRALAIYAPTLETKWVLGVTYVDGGWAKVVPVAGVIYEPTDDVNYELVFPRPRVAWRLPNSPVPGRDEYWAYVLAEFQNLAWAFEQSDGTPDVLASRDYRLILGLERKIVHGVSSRLEVGYVFNRDIKVATISGDDIGIDDTFMLRAGISY